MTSSLLKPKVALCFPNLNWQTADSSTMWHITPYGLCLIASTIEDICEIEIIDANLHNLTIEEFAAHIKKGNFSTIGISVMMDSFADSGHLAAKICKQVLPEAIIIMGGVYPTVHPDFVLQDQGIDFVCLGEGEEVFRNLLLYLWYNAPFPQKGLAYREDDNTIMQERALIKDLDALPLPAYHLIDYKKYSQNAPRKSVDGPIAFPYARILTSRGCPQGCCFCQVKHISGNRFRPRTPKNILDEIKFIKDNYSIKSLIFDDDNIVTQRSRAVKLFQGMIDKGLNLPWKAIAMAVFKLDKELIELMAESGCQYISVAIESGSPRVLKEIIKKPVNLDYAKEMIIHAKKCGIFVSANFIVGFPTETWDEIRQTIRAIELLNPDYAKIFTAIPLRHTRLWELCETYKAFVPNFCATQVSWNTGQICSPHFDAAELTFLRAYEWDRINFSTQDKKNRICQMMQCTLSELEDMRRETRKNALKNMSHA